VLPDGRLAARGAALLPLAAGEPAQENIDLDRWQTGKGSYQQFAAGIWTGAAT
jgi:hypothetical protein